MKPRFMCAEYRGIDTGQPHVGASASFGTGSAGLPVYNVAARLKGAHLSLCHLCKEAVHQRCLKWRAVDRENEREADSAARRRRPWLEVPGVAHRLLGQQALALAALRPHHLQERESKKRERPEETQMDVGRSSVTCGAGGRERRKAKRGAGLHLRLVRLPACSC